MIHGSMEMGAVKSEASVITQVMTSTWRLDKSGVRQKVRAGDVGIISIYVSERCDA